jgi:CspA family cold shock protein
MLHGRVVFYDPSKGFGFVEPDGGDTDIFVHRSALEAAGIPTLRADDRVTFALGQSRGRPCAVDVKLA